ncbi:hypothetical protein MAP00_005913 [Monascus purpureus]|nr:hypothetical protein MAP00_005913 [Monascus purpureus]
MKPSADISSLSEDLVVFDLIFDLIIRCLVLHLIRDKFFDLLCNPMVVHALILPLHALVISELHIRKGQIVKEPSGKEHMEPHSAYVSGPFDQLGEFSLATSCHPCLFLLKYAYEDHETFEVAIGSRWGLFLFEVPLVVRDWVWLKQEPLPVFVVDVFKVSSSGLEAVSPIA